MNIKKISVLPFLVALPIVPLLISCGKSSSTNGDSSTTLDDNAIAYLKSERSATRLDSINNGKYEQFSPQLKVGQTLTTSETFNYDPLLGFTSEAKNGDGGEAFYNKYASLLIKDYDPNKDYDIYGNFLAAANIKVNKELTPNDQTDEEFIINWLSRLSKAAPTNLLTEFNVSEKEYIKKQVQNTPSTWEMSNDEFKALKDAFTKGGGDPRLMASEGELSSLTPTLNHFFQFKLNSSEKNDWWRADILKYDMVRLSSKAPQWNAKISGENQIQALLQRALDHGNLRFVFGGKDQEGKVVIYPLFNQGNNFNRVEIFEFWRFNDLNTGDPLYHDDKLSLYTSNRLSGNKREFFTWGYNFLPGAAVASDYMEDGKFVSSSAWTNLIGNILTPSEYFFGFADSGKHISVGPNISDGEWTRNWWTNYNLDYDVSKIISAWDTKKIFNTLEEFFANQIAENPSGGVTMVDQYISALTFLGTSTEIRSASSTLRSRNSYWTTTDFSQETEATILSKIQELFRNFFTTTTLPVDWKDQIVKIADTKIQSYLPLGDIATTLSRPWTILQSSFGQQGASSITPTLITLVSSGATDTKKIMNSTEVQSRWTEI